MAIAPPDKQSPRFRWFFPGLLFVTCGCLIAGCPAPPPHRDFPFPEVTVYGVVQKGPFWVGVVRLWSLDTVTGERSATNAEGSILSPEGEYELAHEFADGPVWLEAQGGWFNEVTGWNGAWPVTLSAVSGVSRDARINLNVFTTLSSPRIRRLALGGELSFDEARAQAEGEVLAALGFPAEGVVAFEELNIFGERDGDAMLLALSAILAQGVEPETHRQLDWMWADLEDDGTLGGACRETLRQLSMELNCFQVRTHLRRHLDEDVQKPYQQIPLFEAWVDSDGDGVLNRDEIPEARFETRVTSVWPDRLPLRFRFDAPMTPASLELSGALAVHAGTVSWSSARFENDTVTIFPQTGWPVGADRELVIGARSVFGHPSVPASARPAVTDAAYVYSGLEGEPVPSAVTATGDGGLAFAVLPDDFDRRGFFVRLDERMQERLVAPLSQDFEVLDLTETDDGGFFLVGRIQDLARISRVSPEGVSLWARHPLDLLVAAVVPDGLGGGVACGQTRPDAEGNQRLTLWKFDQDGENVTECVFPGDRENVCHEVLRLEDGFLIVAHTLDPAHGADPGHPQALVIRTDEACGIRWQRALGGSLRDTLNHATRTADGGFVLGGLSSSGDIPGAPASGDEIMPNGWIVRLDQDGELLWQALPGIGFDWDRSVVASGDGRVLSASRHQRTLDASEEAMELPEGVWLVRHEADGRVGASLTLPGGPHDNRHFVALVDSGGAHFLVTRLSSDWFDGEADHLLGRLYTSVLVLRVDGVLP